MKAVALAALASLPLVLLAREAHAQLLFEDQGTSKLGTQPCGGSGCWTNYARVTDVDGDGDLDLVAVNCGGFFSNPTPQPLTIYTNDGAGSFTNGSALVSNYVASLRQVAFGDIDNDGDVDLFAPAAGADQPDALFVMDGGTFTNEAAARLPANLSSDAGATRFGDFDNDGDLDIIVANGYLNGGGPAGLYYNDGAGNFTAAPSGSVPSIGGGNPDDLDLADVDGDFDLDVYVNNHSGQNALWLNDGDGTFTDASSTLPPLGSGSQFHYGPVFCDVDNDGDSDILIDNTGGGYTEQLLINAGNGTFTDETSRITGNSGADDNLVSCVDYDADGDFDIVVGALSSNGERAFTNDGAGNFSANAGAFTALTDPTLWMEFGDLNGDGRVDAFTAQGEGNPQLERVYFGNAMVAADTTPPQIVATDISTIGSDNVVRFKVRDNAVTDEGPRLRRAYLMADSMEYPARFMGGDLYRAVLPPDVAMFTICAEDLAGNADCGEPIQTTTTTTTATTGSSTTGSGSSTGSGTTGSGAGSGGGAGGGGADDGGSEDGCSCRAAGGPSREAGALFGLGAGVFALARLVRRRRKVTK